MRTAKKLLVSVFTAAAFVVPVFAGAVPVMAQPYHVDRGPWAGPRPERVMEVGPRAPVDPHAPWANPRPWTVNEGHPHSGYGSARTFYSNGNVVGRIVNGRAECSSSGDGGHHKRTKDQLSECNAVREQLISDHIYNGRSQSRPDYRPRWEWR